MRVVDSTSLMYSPGSSATGAAPAKFLDRIPLKLRGGELYAVQAEDHYLRLHTSKGSDLILLRLADAVAELEGIEGAPEKLGAEALTRRLDHDGTAGLAPFDPQHVRGLRR